MNITIDQVMNLNPCPGYTREVVQELWKEKESLSLKEILNLDIPINDRLWVLARLVPTEILPEWIKHCDIAQTNWTGQRVDPWAAWLVKRYPVRCSIVSATSAAFAAMGDTCIGYDKYIGQLLTTLIEMTENNND